MGFRVDKQSCFEGARRPWLHDGKIIRTIRETPREKLERETCLSCPAKKCAPHLCPLERIEIGRAQDEQPKRAYKQRPPENFRYYGRVESIASLCRRYGVGVHIIKRWRQEAGILPEKG